MENLKYILTFISDFIRNVGYGSPIGAAFIEAVDKIVSRPETPGQAGGNTNIPYDPNRTLRVSEKPQIPDPDPTARPPVKKERKSVRDLFESPFANLGRKLRIKDRNPK